MLTAPLTGARYPEPTDGPLGALQIGYAVADIEDNTIPRFATTGARDTAYAAWVAAGGTMAAGLYCTVAGRLQRHTGAAWEYVPTHRGTGTTFPSGPVEGDYYRHDLYRSTMVYHSGAWRQSVISTASSDADRASWLAALVGAGLTMHGGFLLYQTDTDQLWAAESGTTLLAVGGLPAYGNRSICQVSRTGITIATSVETWTRVGSWATVTTTAAFTIATNGIITCNRDGWLSVNGYAFSDDNVSGRSGVGLDVPAAAFPVSFIVDMRPRVADTSYANAGMLRQPVHWSGRVIAGNTISLSITQDSADNGSIDYNAYLALEYMA